MTPRRQSNIELLRIISMLMVLAVHIDGASLGLPDLKGDFSALDGRSMWQLGVESLTIIGVNCFTLISGYFGIRLRLKSMVSFLFQCVFYAVGIYTLFFIYQPLKSSWNGWLESFLVLTHTGLWYIPAYFGLMLLSPFLNSATETLGKRRFFILLSAFIAFNVWCGWLWGGSFNPSGYTLVQLIMVYLIGRYIRLHTVEKKERRAVTIMFLLYLATAACVFISSVLFLPKAFAYNSPLVLVESIALFLAFRNMNINSGFINYAAKSAFAVYLIHKAPVVFGGVMKPLVIKIWHGCGLTSFSAFAVALTVAFYLLAMAIDPVRRFIDVKICKLLKA